MTQAALQLPDAAALSALRAWHEGLSSRQAVERFIPDRRAAGGSSRSVIGAVRRQMAAFATSRQRDDLARLFAGAARKGADAARVVALAIEALRGAPVPEPLIGDDVARWLPARIAAVLRNNGIRTLAELTLRVPRRKRWWVGIDGLGQAMARHIEAFFAAHPLLTERARALVVAAPGSGLSPWERIAVPCEVNGTLGLYRAPRASCSLRADNDYEAVQAWLSLHEAPATRRAYRKEAERLMLWAIVERGVALSSLATEDAVAYRAFLRHPTPKARWIGPSAPRTSAQWRPFTGPLSARSAAYALSVLTALFRWLIDKRYVLANPFAGVRVRGTRAAAMDTTRVFSDGEWTLVRTVAEGLEWSYGWEAAAAQRMRFVLDFAYATGLRASELVQAVLGNVEIDAQGAAWLHVLGKGSKAGKVVLPAVSRTALERYLVQRRLPLDAAKWPPATPLLASLHGEAGITATRLWVAMKRFFATAASVIDEVNPALAAKLRRATPHWMRHTHATHALERGADLTTVRDNLRHASVATTSLYLHANEQRRAQQITTAFSGAGR
ncbi:site-specific integrase [Azohydromonas caseinilytica]|uniref:Tyrosine-type recombinase/integrase n=1 Tax=Azohydromonas caseinilytica TaxID=2728836 RepID=A0A848FE40_9BURK|nr:site-specific integrase [Azohydromonas caseinilytica]NML17306.1 tyrosine-type recombinase/integrase [Azohydromonas caseinilytica]